MTYSSSLRASWCLSYSHADKNRWESMCVRIWAWRCDWHASVLDWSIKISHKIDFLLIVMRLDSYGGSVVSLTVFQLCKALMVICSNPNIAVLFKLLFVWTCLSLLCHFLEMFIDVYLASLGLGFDFAVYVEFACLFMGIMGSSRHCSSSSSPKTCTIIEADWYL